MDDETGGASVNVLSQYPTWAIILIATSLLMLALVMVCGHKKSGTNVATVRVGVRMLPISIADPDGGADWILGEGDYYFQATTRHEIRYDDMLKLIEHRLYRSDLARANQYGTRIGHRKEDGFEDYDRILPRGIQLRHRGQNGHDAPGPWDRCEWPHDDTAWH